MPFHDHNPPLDSDHYLQTLMTYHASHLRVRSSFQAIHYASALVSAVASAGGGAAIASCFFSSFTRARSLSPRILENWAEPEFRLSVTLCLCFLMLLLLVVIERSLVIPRKVMPNGAPRQELNNACRYLWNCVCELRIVQGRWLCRSAQCCACSTCRGRCGMKNSDVNEPSRICS